VGTSFLNRRDVDFLLRDWLKADALIERDIFAEHEPATFAAILDLSERLAADAFATHYKKADQNEPRLQGGDVVLIPEIGAALRAFAEAGFFAAPFRAELGGLQLPSLVTTASMAFFMAANIATSAYPMLTLANARLIVAHGNAAQIEAFAKPQIEGRFFGTMCLSEPQAGSSLSDITTCAVPDGDDAYGARYRLCGSKMWISGGDHTLSESIVHLVLAKVPRPDGKPQPGTKGISLFIVPKHLPGGARNDVRVTGLNHKMGYRGAVNCLLAFGDEGGATGWRVGAEGDGLAIMFHMMNEARIMVGLGAAALACRGYRQSLEYARDRPQGRLAGGSRGPAAAPVPIIVHADVKAMLLAQKAYAEGALALVLFCARLVDEATHADDDCRSEAESLLGLLTPVAKAWPSQFGLAANDLAIQIHGGFGYSRDFDVEQIYRDNRLNPIHEGTNGIQAIDLLGRKIVRDPGAMNHLERRVLVTIAKARAVAELTDLPTALDEVWRAVVHVVRRVSDEPDRVRALANASRFLVAFGHVVVAWIWLDQTVTACGLPSGDPSTAAFRAGKIRTCRYFFRCELPTVFHQLRLVETFDETAAAMPIAEF